MQIFTDNHILDILVGSLTALAICMAAGFVGRKIGILTDTVNAGLSGVLVKIALPCMVFVSMMRPFSRELLFESLATLFITGIVYVAGCFTGLLLARMFGASEGEKRVWQFSLTFANVAYMGFPVTYALYGYEGMIYTTMATAAFNILVFSLGVYLFKKNAGADAKVNLKPLILNPALVAIYIGFLFFVMEWRLPENIEHGIGLVGNMSIPLSMMLVGSILAKNRLSTLFDDIKIVPVFIMRLFGLPLVTFFILRMFLQNNVMLEVIVLLVAMPPAAITVIFAEQYNGDTAVASKLVALSSVLCLISIPIISLVIQ